MNDYSEPSVFHSLQQQEQDRLRNENEQLLEIEKSTKALKDFLDSYHKIQPAYIHLANEAYFSILTQFLIENGFPRGGNR